MVDEQARAVLFARRKHGVGFLQASGHSFLTEDCFDPRFSGGNGDLGMKVGVRAHTHDVRVLVC